MQRSMDWNKWIAKNKINQKGTKKGKKLFAYTLYKKSSLQSGGENWNPADNAQIITSIIAEMEKDEKAVKEWNRELTSCE